MSSHKSDLVDLAMIKHHETDLAIIASDDGERAHAVSLPKSQIEIDDKGNRHVIVTMPEWLAVEKGLA
jgi:hypothetical protein